MKSELVKHGIAPLPRFGLPSAPPSLLETRAVTDFLQSGLVSRSIGTRPLSETEYVQTLLDLANAGGLPWPRWLDFCRSGRVPEFDPNSPRYVGVNLHAGVIECINMPEKEHGDLIKLLAGILKNWRKASQELISTFLQAGLNGVVCIPELIPGNSRPMLRYRVIADNPASAINHGVYVLLGANELGESFAKELCRCQLEGCKKFFLAEKGKGRGPRRRSYCTKEHQQEGNRRDTANRVARKRTADTRAAKHK